MHQIRYRKYPRVYEKKHRDEADNSIIDLSIATAACIVAFTFVKGMFWGYLLRKRME